MTDDLIVGSRDFILLSIIDNVIEAIDLIGGDDRGLVTEKTEGD